MVSDAENASVLLNKYVTHDFGVDFNDGIILHDRLDQAGSIVF